MAELLVHAWEVDCIDDIKKHQLRNRTGNVSARNAFLSRAGLMCYGRCVRGVVDGFATHAEIEEMLSIAPVPKPGQSSDIKQWRWEPPPERPQPRSWTAARGRGTRRSTSSPSCIRISIVQFQLI